MTDRPTQLRKAKNRERERKRALGLTRKEVWVHPDDWPKIRDAVDRAARKREKT